MTATSTRAELDADEEKVSDETFFKIFGAGKRKVMETPLKVRFDNQVIEFTIKQLPVLQEAVDAVLKQNTEMYAEISQLRGLIARGSASKERIRVKARGVRIAA